MIQESVAREVLAKATSTGGDFAEIFLEDRVNHSLRLRRRECARPPLSEKIIIKPLKKVEDHLWKLENPE